MKMAGSLVAFALVAGSTSAFAGDNFVPVTSMVHGIKPESVNGVPFVGGFNNRDDEVLYDNSLGAYFSTSSTPRWNLMDDGQFTAVPADTVRAGDPILGNDGPFAGGNVKARMFQVGFVWTGGAATAPRVAVRVRLFDQDVVNTSDDPVNNPAKFIGGFSVVFNVGAQTGNAAYSSVLFDVLDGSGNPVSYYIPNGTFGVQYSLLTESVANSGTFDTPAANFTGLFASGDTSAPNLGPTIGGSANEYLRDASADGNFDQTEYRFFTTQTRNANFFWHMEGGCASDFDGDGFLTGDDFDQYVVQFEAGDPSADFNGDGFVTGDDFDLFVASFEKGC